MTLESLGWALASGTAALKERSVISLGVAMALRGDNCVSRHLRDALDAGATRGDFADAVSIAASIGGGPPPSYERRLKHAIQALDASGRARWALTPV